MSPDQTNCIQNAFLLSSSYLECIKAESQSTEAQDTCQVGRKGCLTEREPNQKVMVVSHPTLLFVTGVTRLCVHAP